MLISLRGACCVLAWLDLILVVLVTSSQVTIPTQDCCTDIRYGLPPPPYFFSSAQRSFLHLHLCAVTEFPDMLKIVVRAPKVDGFVSMSATFESGHLFHTWRTVNSSELS